MEFFKRRQPESETFEKSGDPTALLKEIYKRYPNRTKALDVLSSNLSFLKNPVFNRIDGEYDIDQFAQSGVCSRRYASREQYYDKNDHQWKEKVTYSPFLCYGENGLEWSHMYTMDRAVFIIIHPDKKGNRFVSVGNHTFTVYSELRGPTVIHDEPKLFGGYSSYINFRIATSYESAEELENIPGIRFYTTSETGRTFEDKPLVLAGRLLDTPDKFSKYDADVYIPIDDWSKKWVVFGIREEIKEEIYK